MNNTKQIMQRKKDKMRRVKEQNINPYPTTCKRTHKIKELINDKEKFIAEPQSVTITGRLMSMRRHGKIGFADVEDADGKIQLFAKKNVLEEKFEVFKLLDRGDFVEVTGEPFETQRGQYSVRAKDLKILSKSIRPIPTVKEKVVDGKKVRFDEFADIETRYRKRYLDLILNPESKDVFVKRAKILSKMRSFLEEKDFLEVETPMLQNIYGGANASPFVTHFNALDSDFYLRIATELYLKRLIVGGFEKVFEIGKNFRNEGMDRNHNPEFTAVEVYQAYADINDMMDLTEDLINAIGKDVFGQTEFQFGENTISLKKPWRRASMIELIKEHSGFDASDFDFEKIKAFCKEKEIEVEKTDGPGKLIEKLFDAYVEPNIVQPTFVTDFPKEISPLAKKKPGSENLVERFELFIAGDEYANAFTELNDPVDQRERLEAQSKLREMGDVEANVVDEDFLEALEYGMPPTGGLGIGIDRMIMMFTNSSTIKDVMLFPQMRNVEK